eukprot:2757728-Rhodomonas_salina.4
MGDPRLRNQTRAEDRFLVVPFVPAYATAGTDVGNAATKRCCMSGTDVGYAATQSLRHARKLVPFPAMCGTDMGFSYQRIRLVMCGTDEGCAATRVFAVRCAVKTRGPSSGGFGYAPTRIILPIPVLMGGYAKHMYRPEPGLVSRCVATLMCLTIPVRIAGYEVRIVLPLAVRIAAYRLRKTVLSWGYAGTSLSMA